MISTTSYRPWALIPAFASSSGESYPSYFYLLFSFLLTISGKIKATSTAKITATHTTISAPTPPASAT